MTTENILLAFLLTLFAGLSTVIGSFLALFVKRTNIKILSISLGFSAGVMIYVSMVEILPKAQEALVEGLGDTYGPWLTAASFFLGMILIAMIDKLIPSLNNPHSVSDENYNLYDTDDNLKLKQSKLLKMGMFTAIAIAIHNFPEGIATFVAALHDPSLGIAIAIAIAIHNIPEGIAVSIPIYYATGSKMKAFKYSFLSGMVEPLGAILAFLVLMPFLNELVFGTLFAFVAGIMVFISLDELMPTAKEYCDGHLSIYGLISGMMVMALSLLLFI